MYLDFVYDEKKVMSHLFVAKQVVLFCWHGNFKHGPLISHNFLKIASSRFIMLISSALI